MSDNNTCSCNCGKDSKERVAFDLMKMLWNPNMTEENTLAMYAKCLKTVGSPSKYLETRQIKLGKNGYN